MIANGSGLAPFLSFIQYFDIERNEKGIKRQGKVILVYGCRTQASLIEQDKLNKYVKEGILNSFYIAYSQEPGKKKQYVQDVIKEKQEEFG